MGPSARWTAERHEVRTTDGVRIGYDRLIVATGARSVEGVPGATTFRGPLSAGAVEGALRRARERVLFTLPAGAGWTLPLYELALLAAHELPDGPELTIVTPEPRPLDLFGPVASDALARLLDRAGIGFEGETVAEAVVGGALLDPRRAPDRRRRGDRARAPAGPADRRPAGGRRRASSESTSTAASPARRDVFAAGDATAGAIKQGGLAAQQADAAAEAIAAEAGAHLTPRPAAACCAASSSPARRRCSCAATSTTTARSPARCAAHPWASRAPSSGGRPARSAAAT